MRQPFGGAVDGGGQSGRTPADHQEVAHLPPVVLLGRADQAEGIEQGPAARVAQQRPPGTTTIGRSSTGTSSSRSIASASGDASSSSHLDGSRLRASTSSSRRVSGSKREPTRVRPDPRMVQIGVAEQKGPQDHLAQVELLGHDHPHLVDRDPQDAAPASLTTAVR